MKRLDRYLTTPPPDDYTPYFEAVDNAYSDDFFAEIESTFNCSDQEERWISNLLAKGKTPEQSAEIIERAYRIYFR